MLKCHGCDDDLTNEKVRLITEIQKILYDEKMYKGARIYDLFSHHVKYAYLYEEIACKVDEISENYEEFKKYKNKMKRRPILWKISDVVYGWFRGKRK